MGCASASRVHPATAKLAEENLLADYELGEMLGQGAFGVVYKCEKKGLDGPLAVKMIDKVESPLSAIRREVLMQKRLEHPNIVKIHEVFYDSFFVCVIMTRCPGGNLLSCQMKYLKEVGPLCITNSVHISRQMLASVSFLHAHSCVHRDIKGDNYLLDRDDLTDPKLTVLLSDFGTVVETKPAKILTEKCGTKMYWSPEFFDLKYNTPVDMWAIGVVVYGLVMAAFPFRGEKEVKAKNLVLPSRLASSGHDFILTCFSRNALQRLTSAAAVKHTWLTQTQTSTEDDPKDDVSAKDLTIEHGNAGVQERRKELVARLEHRQDARQSRVNSAGGPPTITQIFRCAAFDVTDKLDKGMKYQFRWCDKEQLLASAKKTVKRQQGSEINAMVSDGKEHGNVETPDSCAWSGDVTSFMKAGSTLGKNDLKEGTHILRMRIEDAGINTETWGQGRAKTMADLANELQTGASRMMIDASQHKKLIRTVDIIVLRLFIGEGTSRRYLVHMKEVYADGRIRTGKNGAGIHQLAGILKEPHENSVQAAHRVLDSMLKMTDAKVEFDFTCMETCEEEADSPSYPGLQSVYQKTIIDAEVTTTSNDILERIGALHNTELKTKDGSNVERYYQWFTEEQCQKRHVKLRVEGATENSSALVRAPLGFKDEDMLAFHLGECNIDVSKFGQPGHRTLAEFADELATGEASLERKVDGSLLRVVDIVALQVEKEGTGEVLLHAQRTIDGKVQALERLPQMRHRPDENQFLTAWVLIERMLRINECHVILKKNVQITEEVINVADYPGMLTKHRKRTINAVLHQKLPSFDTVSTKLPTCSEEVWEQPSDPVGELA